MLKIIRTTKHDNILRKCIYDDMYKYAIKFLRTLNNKEFKFKKDIYNLLDDNIRISGICNPEVHLGKGNQTSKTLVNKAIKDKFIKII